MYPTAILSCPAALVSRHSVDSYGVSPCTMSQVTHAFYRKHEPRSLLLTSIALATFPTVLHLMSASPSNLRSYLICCGTYYATLVLSIVVYRLSPVHPLSNYPGPVLCKLSKFWLMWITSQGKLHVYIQRLHAEYGPIVRTGR